MTRTTSPRERDAAPRTTTPRTTTPRTADDRAPTARAPRSGTPQPVGPAQLAPVRRIRVAAIPQPARPGVPPGAPSRPPGRVRRVRIGVDRPGWAARDEALDEALDEAAAARPLGEPAPEPLPDPTAMCCSVVRAAVEVLRGDRGAAQLARWVTPVVLDQLAERARLVHDAVAAGRLPAARRGRPVRVRRVRLERRGDSAEATVVLDDDGRVRAAAVRLEARRGQWRVAVLEIA
jgi:hypothetical protein